jgi:hypothetical protein
MSIYDNMMDGGKNMDMNVVKKMNIAVIPNLGHAPYILKNY